eukprot:TRINITY_DN10631_c0_g1_i1.p1 TRINITY_DN10631_c0_g1~~TRINITY_DN10631_c0_g1_i1.p1  ORF type:complete len:283 (-),score=5.91 TRINITY_DN10631_c0_g1_i1:299-1102(-)
MEEASISQKLCNMMEIDKFNYDIAQTLIHEERRKMQATNVVFWDDNIMAVYKFHESDCNWCQIEGDLKSYITKYSKGKNVIHYKRIEQQALVNNTDFLQECEIEQKPILAKLLRAYLKEYSHYAQNYSIKDSVALVTEYMLLAQEVDNNEKSFIDQDKMIRSIKERLKSTGIKKKKNKAKEQRGKTHRISQNDKPHKRTRMLERKSNLQEVQNFFFNILQCSSFRQVERRCENAEQRPSTNQELSQKQRACFCQKTVGKLFENVYML